LVVALWGCRSRKEHTRWPFPSMGFFSGGPAIWELADPRSTLRQVGGTVEILIQTPPWPLSDKAVSPTPIFQARAPQPVGMLSAQLPGCLTVAVAESALRSVRSDALAQGTEEPRISNRETSIVAHTLCCDRREQKHNEQECVLTHGRRRSLGHGEFRWWHSSDADRPRGRMRAREQREPISSLSMRLYGRPSSDLIPATCLPCLPTCHMQASRWSEGNTMPTAFLSFRENTQREALPPAAAGLNRL
jgi:hypothetical protein